MAAVSLSVVIASHNAEAVIETCLSALDLQRREHHAEVVVADSSTDATPEIITERFPWVRLLHFDGPVSVPHLRGRGIAASLGAVIAILDPFSVAAPDWARNVLAAHARDPHLAIGGAVGLHRPESRSLGAWTVYFNEYALFMPPLRGGASWIVPGSNVSYKRSALFDGTAPRYPVFWKTFVNWEIERAGSPLWLADDVLVELNKPIPFGSFLATRYHHARCFAGMRGGNGPMRIVRAVSSPVVPLLLAWRWTRGFWPKRRHRLRFLLTLPGQLALFTVWSLGEAWGYLRGPGRCCEQLYY